MIKNTSGLLARQRDTLREERKTNKTFKHMKCYIQELKWGDSIER